METLRENNNVIFEEFVNNGNFGVDRARNPFSAMGLDQRQEKLNEDVKGNADRRTRPHYIHYIGASKHMSDS